MKTKSIPACASVCTTPRARVSHRMVPSASSPLLSAARSLLMRIELLPELRYQFGIQVSGAFAHLAILEAHHPAVSLGVDRAVFAAGATLPLQHHLVALGDDIAHRRRDRTRQAGAERLDRALEKRPFAGVSPRYRRAADNGPVDIIRQQFHEGRTLAAGPPRESVRDQLSVFR